MYLDVARRVHPLLANVRFIWRRSISTLSFSSTEEVGHVLVTDHGGVILLVVTALCNVADTGKCNVDLA